MKQRMLVAMFLVLMLIIAGCAPTPAPVQEQQPAAVTEEPTTAPAEVEKISFSIANIKIQNCSTCCC